MRVQEILGQWLKLAVTVDRLILYLDAVNTLSSSMRVQANTVISDFNIKSARTNVDGSNSKPPSLPETFQVCRSDVHPMTHITLICAANFELGVFLDVYHND